MCGETFALFSYSTADVCHSVYCICSLLEKCVFVIKTKLFLASDCYFILSCFNETAQFDVIHAQHEPSQVTDQNKDTV